ncbi:uncharacterized protein TrAtP1_011323 [Trichoderma atroviride]|uniref:uncharacterized protein n=1 Tax=Hypocrea atroviridis TaxID=63577 RepID=UPI00331B3EBB|nr:hypothetical protein TrAtP1_011323 [Trichoderma atroviride]
MPREHRSGGHDALRRQTERLRGIFTCKRQDEQLQRRATAENDWQVLERCVCQTHASYMAYDVFPLYSLLLRAYAHPQHPDRAKS